MNSASVMSWSPPPLEMEKTRPRVVVGIHSVGAAGSARSSSVCVCVS